jgi:hypothetical protein
LGIDRPKSGTRVAAASQCCPTLKRKQHRISKWRAKTISKCTQTRQREQSNFDSYFRRLALAGAGGIEPCNNPLPHKDFSIPAGPFDSIFDSKAKALVGMTDDEVAYIEAKGWKASVVLELSIIHKGWLVERGSRAI